MRRVRYLIIARTVCLSLVAPFTLIAAVPWEGLMQDNLGSIVAYLDSKSLGRIKEVSKGCKEVAQKDVNLRVSNVMNNMIYPLGVMPVLDEIGCEYLARIMVRMDYPPDVVGDYEMTLSVAMRALTQATRTGHAIIVPTLQALVDEMIAVHQRPFREALDTAKQRIGWTIEEHLPRLMELDAVQAILDAEPNELTKMAIRLVRHKEHDYKKNIDAFDITSIVRRVPEKKVVMLDFTTLFTTCASRDDCVVHIQQIINLVLALYSDTRRLYLVGLGPCTAPCVVSSTLEEIYLMDNIAPVFLGGIYTPRLRQCCFFASVISIAGFYTPVLDSHNRALLEACVQINYRKYQKALEA